MTVEADFKVLMNHAITIAPFLNVDRWNRPTFDAPVVYAAHVSEKMRMIRSATGEEVVSSSMAVLEEAPIIDPQSKVTLADGRTPKILSTARVSDERGPHHTTLYLG